MGEARLEDLKIGKPKLKWLENVEKDIRAMDMKRWRQRTREREREREGERRKERQTEKTNLFKEVNTSEDHSAEN